MPADVTLDHNRGSHEEGCSVNGCVRTCAYVCVYVCVRVCMRVFKEDTARRWLSLLRVKRGLSNSSGLIRRQKGGCMWVNRRRAKAVPLPLQPLSPPIPPTGLWLVSTSHFSIFCICFFEREILCLLGERFTTVWDWLCFQILAIVLTVSVCQKWF